MEHRFIHVSFSLGFAGTSSFAVLCVGGAFEGEICLVLFCANRAYQLHSCTAICTHELRTVDILSLGKIVVLAAVGFGVFRSFAVDLLHLIKQFLADNRLVGVVYGDPLVFINSAVLNACKQALGSFSLCHVANIGDVFQNIGDNMLVPEDFPFLLIIVGNDTPFSFVLTGRENAQFIQLFVDAHIAHTLASPEKNLLHDRSGFGVHNQLVLIVWVFQVAVLFPRTDILAVLHLGF